MFNLKDNIVNAQTGDIHIFSVGQAGFIIKTNTGKLIGIDLYLSDCVERVEPDHIGYRRLLPKILDPDEIVFDAIVCTHFHKDHYDMDSIPVLMNNNKTELFCALDCKQDVKDQGLDTKRVHFVKPGDFIKLDDICFRFLNCDHGKGAPQAVGVMIESNNARILEVGDTCLRLDRVDEYCKFGKIDVLIAPINGMYGNLNSEDCAVLTDSIKPNVVIPCHYGMFAAHMGSIGEFHQIMDTKYPKNKYIILAQGEKYTLEGENKL